ncbi:fluoride efflux transporter FluC [Streptomyces prasinopilosus]|uniref:Fluoride-specific ion channel FluC n=1 Tax=Streptomyces prasinopilosus TaxID=67344 RepID=A0A1G6SFB1_9ACTN|nr:CrcB family protein [Streptomyces prasinopilosus]SDD15341.1 CrcB protein [Streptomyces prasinopilosus]
MAPLPTETLRARPSPRAHAPVLAVVALGGGAGAAARHAAALRWPTPADGFPWTTLGVNITGCALIGVLMVIITEARTAHPLVRPLLGTGFLGGFTTFSAYAVDGHTLFAGGGRGLALTYLAVTPLAALGAVWLAASATRRALGRRAAATAEPAGGRRGGTP